MVNTMLSSPTKSFVIRDPIHGYVEVASHERIVIDHPITQRLRRINQTGLADFVFPEARTSRFAHSLGAMHLASRFLLATVENSSETDALAFFGEIEDLDLFRDYSVKFDDFDRFLETDKKKGGGGLLAARVDFSQQKLRKKEKYYKRLLALCEAALRLAALLHDLGHLPFSHDFEYALKEYAARNDVKIPKGLAYILSDTPHEAIGHKLADLVFQALIERAVTAVEPPVKAAFALARKILDEEKRYDTLGKPEVGYLGWLHSLVDGELDVDRADYLLRDARALGLEFADYDLARLIHNLVMVRDPELGYVTAVDERGFMSLETYCLARARSGQVFIRHHKNAQFGVSLRHATVAGLMTESAAPFLKDLDALGSTKFVSEKNALALLNRFSQYDDYWWLGLMRSVGSDGNYLLRASLDLVLRRDRSFLSYWKRKGDLSSEEILKLNELVISENIQQRRAKLADQNVLTALHKFRPYGVRSGTTQDSVLVVLTQKGLVPASRLSPLIRSLYNAWEEDPHLFAFGVIDQSPNRADVMKTLMPETSKKAMTKANSGQTKSSKAKKKISS
jgi:HD superfamily phosphohydrolase